MHRWLVMVALLAAGCAPDLGASDETAALEIVYTPEGTPAFAGQAVMQLSCGNGGFCHSEGETIAPADRFGAPAGLDFDMRLASTGSAPNEEEADRLRRHLLRVLDMRGEIFAEAQAGTMPPRGAAGMDYRCQIRPSECGASGTDVAYDRFEDDGVTFSPLPTLLDEDADVRAEAEEILRNWLASRTPVVERTEGRSDRQPNVIGFTVPVCERDCVDLRWPDIYDRILVPGCTSSRCHDADEPAASLDLVTGGMMGVYDDMVAGGATALGVQCMAEGQTLVEPMMPDASLLLLKLEAESADDVCGSRMPLSGNVLSQQRLCVIREWIACGACAEADGGACASCLDMARSTCNVDTSMPGGCASTEPCNNQGTL